MILVLKKCWAWIKVYWKVILFLIAVIPAFFLLRKQDLDYVKEYLLKQKKFFKKELEIVENTEKKKQEDIKQAEKNLEESKKILEEKYNKKFDELDRKNKKELNEMSKALKESPDEYIKKLAQENGWEFVE